LLILGKRDSPIFSISQNQGKKNCANDACRTIDDIHKCHVNVFLKKGMMIMQVPF
jgi:hypothetical protein